MAYKFDSKISIGKPMPEFNWQQIADEPMLFGCDANAAGELGGPITKAFLNAANLGDEDVIIDTRCHMLKTGWWPAIPGWHHDDVARTLPSGQPNYDAMPYRPEHCLAVVNSEICPTQFALGQCEMPRVADGQVTYGVWDKEVERLVKQGRLQMVNVPNCKIVHFDWHSFHRATQASADGWRWFGRATKKTHRKAVNKVRRQVQVYLSAPTAGW